MASAQPTGLFVAPDRATALMRRVALAGLAGFAIISVLVSLGLLRELDAAAMELKHGLTSEAFRRWSEIVAVVFSAEFSMVYTVVGVLLLLWAGLRLWALAPAAFLLGLLVEVTMKLTLYQPRVPGEFQHPSAYPLIFVNLPWSFPSGHALRTGFLLVFLAVLLWWSGGRYARFASAGLVTLILPAAYCRIYMGHHWPSDVVAGLLLGISLALLVAPQVARRLAPPTASPSRQEDHRRR